MSLGQTIAITHYANTDATPGFGRGVPDQPADTLVLHEEDSKAVGDGDLQLIRHECKRLYLPVLTLTVAYLD
jgi:hypothetical protein